MASKFEFFKGKAKWVHTARPDRFDKFSMVLYPDAESLDKINKYKEGKPGQSGILNVIGKDDDGYFVKFTRPQSKTMRGKVVGFATPTVLNKDGMPLTEVLVGNGSDVTVKVEIYTYNTPTKSKGTACRLESIRVDNLIPFVPVKDFDEDTALNVKGLLEQPPQPLF